jgi:hypothetical protein
MQDSSHTIVLNCIKSKQPFIVYTPLREKMLNPFRFTQQNDNTLYLEEFESTSKTWKQSTWKIDNSFLNIYKHTKNSYGEIYDSYDFKDYTMYTVV